MEPARLRAFEKRVLDPRHPFRRRTLGREPPPGGVITFHVTADCVATINHDDLWRKALHSRADRIGRKPRTGNRFRTEPVSSLMCGDCAGPTEVGLAPCRFATSADLRQGGLGPFRESGPPR